MPSAGYVTAHRPDPGQPALRPGVCFGPSRDGPAAIWGAIRLIGLGRRPRL